MLHYSSLLQPLLDLAKSDPQCVVLYGEAGPLKARDLLDTSIYVAANLQSKGFKPEDVAVIAAQPGEEFLQIMYAVIMLGGKIAIIDPEMGSQNYAAKMAQLKPGWMFVDSRLLLLGEHPLLRWSLLKLNKSLPHISMYPGSRLVSVGRSMPVLRRHLTFRSLQQKPAVTPELIPDAGTAESVIIYTSGTLDVPKGVLHTAGNLDASIRALGRLFAGQKGAIVGTYLPHFMLLGIAAGLPVKLTAQHMVPAEKISWITRENIGILFGPPSEYLPLIQYCEVSGTRLPSCLRHILIGSAPVHVLFLQRLIGVLPEDTQITCTYGMTEHLLVAVVDGREKAAWEADGDLLGKPVAGVSVRIAADREIFVKSAQLFSRYFHEEKGNEWHATGDLGRLDGEGNIILSGRKKEMIIRRNMNIYPALYESTIKHISGVDEAAMVGVYDESLHDEKVYLAVEGAGINVMAIESMLQSGRYSIDREALPDHIFCMTIPRKGRQHKIDRGAIVAYIKKHGL